MPWYEGMGGPIPTMRRSTMIQVEHLTKCYGDFMAVHDLSFEIE